MGLGEEQEEDNMIADIMRFLLFWERTKKPVARLKVIEQTGLPAHVKGSSFDYLIYKARQRFRDVFGLDLVELEGGKKKKKKCLMTD